MPAFAFGTTSMVMSSVEGGQKDPFELFHLNVYIPVVSPVTVVVGDA